MAIERTNEKDGETIKETGGRRQRHKRDKAREQNIFPGILKGSALAQSV
jgi:hypothetical protein